MDYQKIGQSYLDKYNIILCPRSVCTCWQRPHAHCPPKQVAKICKMDLPKSRYSLFAFLHEVGHIAHPQGSYELARTRALAEFNATQWGIEEMRKLGITVPRKLMQSYNNYVRNKIARGLRRGLKKVPKEIRHLRPRSW